MTFDPDKGHHHLKCASVVLLSKFGSHCLTFLTPAETFVALSPYMLLTKFSQKSDHVEADCQKRKKEIVSKKISMPPNLTNNKHKTDKLPHFRRPQNE